MTSTAAHRTHTVEPSPIGDLTLVADGGALVGVYMAEHLRRPDAAALGDRTGTGVPVLGEAARQLDEHFAGERRSFDLPLSPVGSTFQRRVWAALETIPYGETRTYAGLAAALGDPRLVRAVGAANALNPLSVVVPCHRVVGADGSLVGFAGGLWRKRFLLDLEAGDRLF